MYPFFQLSLPYLPTACQPPSRAHAALPRAGKGLRGDDRKMVGFIHRNAPSPLRNSQLASKESLLCQEMKRLTGGQEGEQSTVMPENRQLLIRPGKFEDLWFKGSAQPSARARGDAAAGGGAPPACWGPRASDTTVQPLAKPCVSPEQHHPLSLLQRERSNKTG